MFRVYMGMLWFKASSPCCICVPPIWHQYKASTASYTHQTGLLNKGLDFLIIIIIIKIFFKSNCQMDDATTTITMIVIITIIMIFIITIIIIIMWKILSQWIEKYFCTNHCFPCLRMEGSGILWLLCRWNCQTNYFKAEKYNVRSIYLDEK